MIMLFPPSMRPVDRSLDRISCKQCTLCTFFILDLKNCSLSVFCLQKIVQVCWMVLHTGILVMLGYPDQAEITSFYFPYSLHDS